MNAIEINNQSEKKIEIANIKKIVKNILKIKNVKDKTISVVFLKADEMRKVNKRYRKIDKATDVLSFEEGRNSDFLGEIAISPEIVGGRIKKGSNYSLKLVLIHGVLHLLGYDHDTVKNRKIMREEEEWIVKMLTRNT